MIKSVVKEFLLKLRKLLYKKYNISKDYSFKIISHSKYDIFCGYYDKIPFSNCGRYLFYNKKNNNTVEVVCYDLLLDKEISFGKSLAWSTQLGARIFWLDNSKNIGFNDLENKQQIFVLKDFKTKKILRKINYPIFDINRENTLGLSLDFNKLEHSRPGYGFFGKNSFKESIGIVNLKKNTCKKILSIKDLESFLNLKNYENPYFNHLSWSPCGDFFIFFFLWSFQNKKYNQVFIFNYKSKEISKISKDNEVVSHFNWIDNNNLILTVKNKVFRYTIFNIKNKTSKKLHSFPENLDGHPSINPKDKTIFVTDTYPNYLGNQKLFIIKENNKILVGEFFLPKEYFGANKNDLHPRWSNDGKCIAVDVAFSGRREIMVLKEK